MWVAIYLNFGPEVHSHERKTSLRIHVVRGAAYARSSNYGAGSTGWLEREAAGNPERTSGHFGSRDVRSHKKKLFLN